MLRTHSEYSASRRVVPVRGVAARNSSSKFVSRMNALSASPLDSSFAAVLEEIASELDLRPLLTRLIARACGLLDSAQGAIGLYVPQRNVVQIEAIYRLPETELSMEFEPGEGLVGRVLLTGAPIIADRYGDLGRISLPEHAEDAVIGAPIYGAKGELIGVFGIGAPPPRRFGPADLETLQSVLSSIAS